MCRETAPLGKQTDMSSATSKKSTATQKKDADKTKDGPIYINGVFPLRNNATVYGSSKFAAVCFTLYLIAEIAMWTGLVRCPMVRPSVKYLKDKVSLAFAGWHMCSIFYMVLVHMEVPLHISNTLAMIPYIAIDYFAVCDTAHWTPLAYGFLVLDVFVLVASLAKHFKCAAAVNWLYTFAGAFTFFTMTAPVLVHPLNDFQRAWAGWKFAGCTFFALINLGVPTLISTFATLVFFLAVDLVIVDDHRHWKNAGWDGTMWLFVVHCGLAGFHQLMMFMEADRASQARMKVLIEEAAAARRKEAASKAGERSKEQQDPVAPKNKDL